MSACKGSTGKRNVSRVCEAIMKHLSIRFYSPIGLIFFNGMKMV